MPALNHHYGNSDTINPYPWVPPPLGFPLVLEQSESFRNPVLKMVRNPGVDPPFVSEHLDTRGGNPRIWVDINNQFLVTF